MAGHYGHELQTIQNQNVLAVDLANNLLIITGAIPGPTGSVVTIKEAIKPHKKNLEFKIINKKLQAEIEAMNKKIEEDKESLHAAAMAEKAEEKKGGAK
jgi:large subunit ribosomal protein L3